MTQLKILPPEKARAKARAKVSAFQANKRRRALEEKRAAAKPAPEPIVKEVKLSAQSQKMLNEKLLEAVKSNSNEEVVNDLLEAGAHVNCRDSEGRTPLDFARYPSEHVQVIAHPLAQLLRRNGGRTGAQMKDMDTMLLEAAHVGDRGKIMRLVGKGANIDARDSVTGMTPLMFAVQKPANAVVAKAIIELGADVGITSKFGKTALAYLNEHIASSQHTTEERLLALVLDANTGR